MSACAALSRFDGHTLLRGLYWHWRKSPFLWIGFPVVGLCSIALSLLVMARLGRPALNEFILLVVGLFFLFRYRIARAQFRFRLASHPLHDSDMDWTFTPEGLVLKTAHSTIQSDWDAYLQTYTTPDGFLLYPQKSLFYWIPRAAFPSEAQAIALEEILAAQPHHKRLG